jgi:hypothetical protein
MVKVIDSNVEFRVPVEAEYVSVVRLLVSGLGTRLGLVVDELEKLKLLVGESFLTIVAQCEQEPGLMRLTWVETGSRIQVSLSDPSGKHKSVTDSGNLALLKTIGGEFSSRVVDGIDQLDIGFDIQYREDRPFLFHEREDGRA